MDDLKHTKSLRQSKQLRFDQILSNLNSLLKSRSADSDEDSQTVEDNNDFTYKPNEEEKVQLNEVLYEVTNTLDKIKKELIQFNKEGLLTIEIPKIKHERRYKRDLSNDTESNVTSAEKTETVTVTTTEEPENVTETVEPLLKEVKNETEDVKALRNDDVINKNDTVLNNRRLLSQYVKQSNLQSNVQSNLQSNLQSNTNPQFVKTTSRVKDKLLSYLEDTFNEVERKIKPLANIKIALSNDDHYRIGYIIATIDTLEVNLKKMKNDMNLHQHLWGDEKILDLFDRIKATNTVATSLIESLKKYLPRK